MKRPMLLLTLLALLLPLTSAAQVANENLANAILAARKNDAALLSQYTWNSRVEILQNGAVQDIRIDMVNLGPDGQPVRTLLNDTPGSLPNGFLRKDVAENKRKDLEKYIFDLSKLINQYTLPAGGAVVAFLVQAQVQPITTPDGKTILQVKGNNVVIPGDTYALTVDGRSMETSTVKISTTYNGDPVNISATFKAMKNGVNHLEFATIDLPAKSTSVMIQNYDYVSNN